MNIDAHDKTGRTALMFALSHAVNLKAVEALLDAGADTRVRDALGRSAYDLAQSVPGFLETRSGKVLAARSEPSTFQLRLQAALHFRRKMR